MNSASLHRHRPLLVAYVVNDEGECLIKLSSNRVSRRRLIVAAKGLAQQLKEAVAVGMFTERHLTASRPGQSGLLPTVGCPRVTNREFRRMGAI